MSQLVILAGGTAGTLIANKLRNRLDRTDWNITVVDRDDEHHYQPGYLFLPFGEYSHRGHGLRPDRCDRRDRDQHAAGLRPAWMTGIGGRTAPSQSRVGAESGEVGQGLVRIWRAT
jgi:hypothetical protein